MRRLLFLLLAAAVVTSCAPSETVRTGSAVPQAAAARQGTYALIPFDETIAVGVFNEAVLEGLEDALAAALEAKGYSRVSEAPDESFSPTTGATGTAGESRSGTPTGSGEGPPPGRWRRGRWSWTS
jgi:hypothetical protein